MFADAVDGISILNNQFINCCDDVENRPDDYKSTVVLFNCGNINNTENIDVTKKEVSFTVC